MTTPPPPDQRLKTLVVAQAAARARWHVQAQAAARNAVRSFRGWYDTDAITDWAQKLAAQIETYQRAVAHTTDAYLAQSLTILTGQKVRPIGRIDVTTLRGDNVTHAGAYGRVADVYRFQQSKLDRVARDILTGDVPNSPDIDTPTAAALERALTVADYDIQLADRGQSAATLGAHAARHEIRGYRRVIHPEKSRGGSCGLCIAASDRVYHVEHLRPIHARCECTELPIVGQHDPGAALNKVDLGELYEHAGSTRASELKRTRYQIDEHGELGPVLNPAGTKQRTARQATRDTNTARRSKTPAEKRAQAERIRAEMDAALPAVRDLAAQDPGAWGDYLTQLEARIGDLDQQLAA